MSAFEQALDKCMEASVDFIVVAGDLFHVGVPEMAVVNAAVRKMKEVLDRGIQIYAIYGSHDYSPNDTSIVDILDSAGLILKVGRGKVVEGRLQLQFIEDARTGAKLTGISARSLGLETRQYENLDRSHLEAEPGFKIFVFHSGVRELLPDCLSRMDSLPLAFLPRGFSYYAGGHLHERIEGRYDLGFVRYPGPLFAGYPRDFEETAKGVPRGFYRVSVGDKVEKTDFIEVNVCSFTLLEFDASGLSGADVQNAIVRQAESADVQGKVVLLKVHGELSSGKTSEVSFAEIRGLLAERGALYVHVNRYGFTSRRFAGVQVEGRDLHGIEAALFQQSIQQVTGKAPRLSGSQGVSASLELLRSLRQEARAGETKRDYEARLLRSGIDVLGLREVFQ